MSLCERSILLRGFTPEQIGVLNTNEFLEFQYRFISPVHVDQVIVLLEGSVYVILSEEQTSSIDKFLSRLDGEFYGHVQLSSHPVTDEIEEELGKLYNTTPGGPAVRLVQSPILHVASQSSQSSLQKFIDTILVTLGRDEQRKIIEALSKETVVSSDSYCGSPQLFSHSPSCVTTGGSLLDQPFDVAHVQVGHLSSTPVQERPSYSYESKSVHFSEPVLSRTEISRSTFTKMVYTIFSMAQTSFHNLTSKSEPSLIPPENSVPPDLAHSHQQPVLSSQLTRGISSYQHQPLQQQSQTQSNISPIGMQQAGFIHLSSCRIP